MPPLHPASPSRRVALQTLALAAWATSGPSGAQTQTRFDPPPAAPNGLADAWRAMSRLGYGPSAALAAEVLATTPRVWALQQLATARQATQALRMPAELQDINAPLPQLFAGAQRERQARASTKATAGEATPPMNGGERERLDFSGPTDAMHFNRTMVEKTAVWRLMACSLPDQENPLLARMTEFWFNHLNVYIGKGAVRPFVGHYLINVARAHALGTFEDLLLASARHPAMLHYLDQANSVAPGTRTAQGGTRGLNENYARELMELHTLGVDGGYTQTDVRELARVLTGWTVGPQAADGFRFAVRMHDAGSKKLMGRSYPESLFGRGEQEGIDAIRMLARHPRTAARLSLRLAQFFVADQPAPALVARLSQVFLDSGGDIQRWLQALLESADFWDPSNRLFKTPMDFACSALTATQTASERKSLLLAIGFLANAGQPLHGWQTPDGYPTDAATWLAPEALTRRADFALQLGQPTADLSFLLPFLSEPTRQAITQERPRLRNGLLLASPEFMYK
jgi:uncharacterized protein (DUF1800 family)